ncbi:transcription termination/antitermination protein NusG [Eisenibacter elegans]|uniref:transcription termination/antitermination protein NusG n=1 Tax=Eisenibacter elegans TaxID=997 RepID=UPI000405E153|nr:transcription termination/antitermination protein NusG [Eisenibacter elegans]
MSDYRWYAVRSIAGQEKKAIGYLELELSRKNLQDNVPQILIPTEKVYEVRNGKKKLRERSYLPGYILIQADLSNGEVIPVITNVPGIIGFLGSEAGASKEPIPLRQDEVDRILGNVSAKSDEEEKLETPFIVGEHVKVTDGPFNDFTGVVQEVFEERKRLNVMVKIFGRNTLVELNYMQVEKQD